MWWGNHLHCVFSEAGLDTDKNTQKGFLKFTEVIVHYIISEHMDGLILDQMYYKYFFND